MSRTAATTVDDQEGQDNSAVHFDLFQLVSVYASVHAREPWTLQPAHERASYRLHALECPQEEVGDSAIPIVMRD